MPEFDYAVIGAGVFGAWVARALCLRGRRVLLVDQYGPAHTRASSGGETRILRMGYGAKEIYTRWSWRALAMYRDFYATCEPDLLQAAGCLWLCADGDAAGAATVQTFRNNGIRHEVLDPGAIMRRFPQFHIEPGLWGVYEPDAAALLARRGVQAVVRETVKLGLAYRQLTAPIQPGLAAATIYACGPWLPKLFPELLGHKIRPTRQEVLYFGTAPGDPAWRAPAMPCWIDSTSAIYGIPDIEDRGFKLAIDAHGPQVDPDSQSRVLSPATVELARDYLARRFPALRDAPVILSEVCQYENTASGDYLIDRHPDDPNVWLLGGGSGHGYKHGPIVGDYLAAVLEDGAPIDPIFSLAAKTDYAAATRKSTI